jgi:membrane protein
MIRTIMYLKELYQNAKRIRGEWLDILGNALRSFREQQASQASAGLAYYALFSIFPLLLVFIAGGSYFLDSSQVFNTVTQFVQQTLPVPEQAINENLHQILKERGTAGLLSILTLLWSASGMFTNLAHNINLAWSRAAQRSFLQDRLIAFGMIVGLILLIALSLILSWLTQRMPFMNIARTSASDLVLLRLLSGFGSWLMIFLVFFTLYHWIPALHVRWRATFWGALIASLAWKAATTGFAWYLDASLQRYQLVYGSLGATVAFLFLIYIISLITLFGAHLSAAIEGWEKDNVNVLAT